jgi:hypothetical protein
MKRWHIRRSSSLLLSREGSTLAVRRFLGNERSGHSSPDAAARWAVSWRAPAPAFGSGEEVVWKCAACRQDASGLFLTAGDLYVTQERLILQPPRWARAPRRIALSYPLGDCTSFRRGDLQRIGRSQNWGSTTWKPMLLELVSGETVGMAVRRPDTAVEVITRAIDAAHRPLGPAAG